MDSLSGVISAEGVGRREEDEAEKPEAEAEDDEDEEEEDDEDEEDDEEGRFMRVPQRVAKRSEASD